MEVDIYFLVSGAAGSHYLINGDHLDVPALMGLIQIGDRFSATSFLLRYKIIRQRLFKGKSSR